MRDGNVRRPLSPDELGQRPRVDTGDADPSRLAHPLGKTLARAIVRRLGDHFAHQATERMRLARFDVFVISAYIADVRESEGDDLPGVARVGHHFLVAGHRGVEAKLADRFAFGAEPLPPHHAPVGEHHDSRRALGLRCAQRSCVGHGRMSLPSGVSQRCR